MDGPTLIGFNTTAFMCSHSEGWLKDYRDYAGGDWRDGADMVDYVATNFSINPRLLLAMLEYQIRRAAPARAARRTLHSRLPSDLP